MEWLAGREGRAREERHGTSGIWGWCSSVQNCRPESDQLIRHMNSASSSYAVKSRDWRAKQGVASSVGNSMTLNLFSSAHLPDSKTKVMAQSEIAGCKNLHSTILKPEREIRI